MDILWGPNSQGCQRGSTVCALHTHSIYHHDCSSFLWMQHRTHSLITHCGRGMWALCVGQNKLSAHVLHHCPTALELWCYNTRHDAVLEAIKQSITPLYLFEGNHLLADLATCQPYTFPSHCPHWRGAGCSGGSDESIGLPCMPNS